MPAASDAAPRRFRTALAFAAALAVLGTAGLAGCADFNKGHRPAGRAVLEEQRIVRGQAAAEDPPPCPEDLPSPPPGPCVDPDPNVITTCLASTAGLIPGDERGDVTIVAERTTGRIVSAKRFSKHKLIVDIPGIDASGDGGLIDFAPSPTYSEDRLIYALITTATDNRIVRIAAGDVPKPILTGIPKGPTGNLGLDVLPVAQRVGRRDRQC